MEHGKPDSAFFRYILINSSSYCLVNHFFKVCLAVEFQGIHKKTAPSAVASEISDATLLTNDSLNTKTTSTLAKRDEIHQYVGQVYRRIPSKIPFLPSDKTRF